MSNKFIVTNVEHRVEAEQQYASIVDPYSQRFQSPQRQHQSFELTLQPTDVDENTMFKLQNIAKAGRTVILQDTEYADFMEPFRHEFIDFTWINTQKKL